MAEIKNSEDFYIKEGLYTIHEIDNSDKEDLFNLLFTLETVDCYCVECGSNSVFKPDDNRPRKSIQGIGSHWPIESVSEWSTNIEESTILETKKFICSRNDNHALIFHILLKDKKLQKIGQYPSIRDLNISEIKGFKSILKDQFFKEYSTAIGLHSHGVGIGAFVYLRRIVENFIIKPAHEEAKKSAEWSEEDFQKNRMKERIDALKDYLPEYLVTNKVLYSVVSKGIHELSEDECNEYFPLISSVLNYILTELKEKKETEKSKAEMAKRLSDLGGKIK